MTAEAAGAVPDDVIDTVYDALAVKVRDACCADRRKACPECARYLDGVEAALSVPALAEVIARDAKVRGIVGRFPTCGGSCGMSRAEHVEHIATSVAALYPEAGKPSGERRLSLPESADDLRAARDALHAEIGREAAIRIILGQEEAMMRDGGSWSLTNRAMIALDWLGASKQAAARIAYRFRTRIAGAVCPVCSAAVEIGDEAVQWTDDAITHEACAALYPEAGK